MTREEATPRGMREKWRVDADTGCYVWIGAVAGSGVGYGYLKVQGRAVRAHRYFYERDRGPIPSGHVLHHMCENTRCVNPAHLEPVVQGINLAYAYASGNR